MIVHDVRIDEGSLVTNSVVMPNLRIDPVAVVQGVILDNNAVVADGALVWVDFDVDFHGRHSSIVVLGTSAKAL